MTPRNGASGPVETARGTTPIAARKRTPPVRHCRHHCATCGRHFAGIAAFDAHRQGAFDAPTGSLDGRRCVGLEHDEDERFEAVPGVCTLSGDETLVAAVWRRARADEVARYFRPNSHLDDDVAAEELALAA